MKSAVLLLVVAFAAATIASGAVFNGADMYAEPNCENVNDHHRLYRDILDPTFYWVCPKEQDKAEHIQCPDNMAFMEQQQSCVVWDEWKWIEPYTK